MNIRTPSHSAVGRIQQAQLAGQLKQLKRTTSKKSFRKKATLWALIGGNVLLLLAAVSFVVILSRSNNSDAKTNPALVSDSQTVQGGASPVDKLSAADIAESVASLANLPEATAVKNQADTVTADLAITPAESAVAAKPQIVATNLKSIDDLQIYVSQPGDTVSKLAARFGITSNSLEWSNGLISDTITPGTKLYIPPVSGIVYVVKPGDTAASLAKKFGADAQQITDFNNAELTGLKPGQRIVIPNGQQQPAQNTVFSDLTGSVPSGGFVAIYGNNGYDYGFCTWYVASQIAVPNNWGNASSWSYYAAQSGWKVSSTPQVGDIAQTPYAAGGEGHVAIVVGVNGSQIEIKDMNGLAGWGRVGEGWVSASKFPNYISH